MGEQGSAASTRRVAQRRAGGGRSTANYPSDVAGTIHPASFIDVSCASATTVDMTQLQSVPFGGTNPAQFNAIGAGDGLVTIGIGGNDAALIGVAEDARRSTCSRRSAPAARTTTTAAAATRGCVGEQHRAQLDRLSAAPQLHGRAQHGQSGAGGAGAVGLAVGAGRLARSA